MRMTTFYLTILFNDFREIIKTIFNMLKSMEINFSSRKNNCGIRVSEFVLEYLRNISFLWSNFLPEYSNALVFQPAYQKLQDKSFYIQIFITQVMEMRQTRPGKSV